MYKNRKMWYWIGGIALAIIVYRWYKKKNTLKVTNNSGSANGSTANGSTANGSTANGSHTNMPTTDTFLTPESYGTFDRSTSYLKQTIMAPVNTKNGKVYTNIRRKNPGCPLGYKWSEKEKMCLYIGYDNLTNSVI